MDNACREDSGLLYRVSEAFRTQENFNKTLTIQFSSITKLILCPQDRAYKIFSQFFPFYISSAVTQIALIHSSFLGLTYLTPLLTPSSSRESTKSHTTSWSSTRSCGMTLQISWSQIPRGSSNRGPHQGYAPALQSLCCQRSLDSCMPMSNQWTTSPVST